MNQPKYNEDGKSEVAQHVVVIGEDGSPIGQARIPFGAAEDGEQDGQETSGDISGQVEQPAKVMRIGTMIKQLLEEVRAAPLDEASRNKLRQIHQSSIEELEEGLSPELRAELERLTLPFDEEATPSESELRIAQAQLVGWLEGLFHGIQTALFAQQMAARVQLEQMRRGALPPGTGQGHQEPGDHLPGRGTGQYL
jgi:Bacterial proteasome activator